MLLYKSDDKAAQLTVEMRLCFIIVGDSCWDWLPSTLHPLVYTHRPYCE